MPRRQKGRKGFKGNGAGSRYPSTRTRSRRSAKKINSAGFMRRWLETTRNRANDSLNSAVRNALAVAEGTMQKAETK